MAKKSLDNAIGSGISEFLKIDILLQKLEMIIGDQSFLSLIEMLLNSHCPGVSTGSCLSPILSNIYLAEFDQLIEDKH